MFNIIIMVVTICLILGTAFLLSDNKSNINKRRGIYFKDYLDELGIKIEDAWTKENRDKLTNLMKEKFKDAQK